ncbi:MAG: hypothetical protein FJ040_10380 [Chloroflexi bacterium]|nr:hypothetical protein [Chloroflexota bacterium]
MGMGEALALVYGVNFVLWLWLVIGVWKMFVKAGQPGWAIMVPYYNQIVLHRILGLPIAWFVYSMALNGVIVVAGWLNQEIVMAGVLLVYVVYGWVIVRLSLRAFGQHDSLIATAIAYVVPFVLVYRIGYSRSVYGGPPSHHDVPYLPWFGNKTDTR